MNNETKTETTQERIDDLKDVIEMVKNLTESQKLMTMGFIAGISHADQPQKTA